VTCFAIFVWFGSDGIVLVCFGGQNIWRMHACWRAYCFGSFNEVCTATLRGTRTQVYVRLNHECI
jgi:hypothetical protein